MQVKAGSTAPPAWTRIIPWGDRSTLVDRRRIVVRFNPKLTSVPSAADHAIALVEKLSPVPLEFRALDRVGTTVFEAQEDFDFVPTLGRIETRLRHALPCGHA